MALAFELTRVDSPRSRCMNHPPQYSSAKKPLAPRWLTVLHLPGWSVFSILTQEVPQSVRSSTPRQTLHSLKQAGLPHH